MEGITYSDYMHTEKSFSSFQNWKFRWILWFVCFRGYIIASCCIWEFSEYVSWNISKILPILILHLARSLKKSIVELDLLINMDKLLMVEKGIKGGVNHAIHQYVNTSNSYMKKNWKKLEESLYLKYMQCKYFTWMGNATSWSWCSISLKIILFSHWFIIFTWNNENWKRLLQTCCKLALQKISYTWEV